MGFTSSVSLFSKVHRRHLESFQNLVYFAVSAMRNAMSPSKTSPRRKVLVLAGPTCVGKSAIAMQLSKLLPDPIEIISADSVQVYEGLDVGSNKPSLEERATVEHHLIDLTKPSIAYTAGQFFRDARGAVELISTRSHIPVAVGGTMMYVRWFLYGIPATPRPEADVIERVDAQISMLNGNWNEGIALLESKDPVRAASIVQNDWYRLKRALQIVESTQGIGVSKIPLRGGAPHAPELQNVSRRDLDHDFRCFFLYDDRVSLNRRIDARCERMIFPFQQNSTTGKVSSTAFVESGDQQKIYDNVPDECARPETVSSEISFDSACSILTEVANLLMSRTLSSTESSPARAIGYRQTIQYLVRRALKVKGCERQHMQAPLKNAPCFKPQISREAIENFREYLEDFQQATRGYAKQQLSWFRREREFMWVRADESAAEKIASLFSLDEEKYDMYMKKTAKDQECVRCEMIEQGKLMKTYLSQCSTILRESQVEDQVVRLGEALAAHMADTLSEGELSRFASQPSLTDSIYQT